LPLRGLIIRSTNQVLYSVFAKSYMGEGGGILIGKGGYLFEMGYVEKFCKSSPPDASPGDFDLWAQGLLRIAKFFEERGKVFLFVISPSKPAYFPEYLPHDFDNACRATRPDYHMAVAALSRARIPFVDTSRTILEGKGKYEVELFSRGGTHWNQLGAALAAKEIALKIAERRKADPQVAPFTYTVAFEAGGRDVDLLSLLNLLLPDRHYPVAQVSFASPPPRAVQPLRLAIVGGSFIGLVIEPLQRMGAVGQADYFYYLTIARIRFPGGLDPHFKPDVLEEYRDLLQADIVLVEENEANLRSNHVRLLAEALRNIPR
jgi:alginate O-acetyltransferase complex protein AlgJ